jgi:cation diffusion facilitator family transporter
VTVAESLRAVVAALVANLAIGLLKLTTGLLAGSASMLAEAAHSFSDVGNQALLLLGLRRSDPAPTREHPFGTAKRQYFWSFLVAVLLFTVAGTYSLVEGIRVIRHPHELGDIRLSLGVLGAAFVLEAGALTVAARQAREAAEEEGADSLVGFVRSNRDATLLTILVEDTVALVGLPIAAAALGLSVWTGNPIWDGIGSVLIGLLLMGFALFLGWEVRDLLVGEGLSPRDRERVLAVLEDHPDVVQVARVQSLHLGADTVLLGVEAQLAGDPAEAIERVEAALEDVLEELAFVYVEPVAAEDATPG